MRLENTLFALFPPLSIFLVVIRICMNFFYGMNLFIISMDFVILLFPAIMLAVLLRIAWLNNDRYAELILLYF